MYKDQGMYKEVLAMTLVTLFIILTTHYWAEALQYILDVHDFVANVLTYVFSDGTVGKLISTLVAYLLVPFSVSLICAGIYALIKREFIPYFMQITWAAWFVQTTALILYA